MPGKMLRQMYCCMQVDLQGPSEVIAVQVGVAGILVCAGHHVLGALCRGP